ncbi:MAG: hypothetical protein VXU46_06130 [Planctomycetota bacterium]|nr:hypothetical protein [Planctomycetota bacterium]
MREFEVHYTTTEVRRMSIIVDAESEAEAKRMVEECEIDFSEGQQNCSHEFSVSDVSAYECGYRAWAAHWFPSQKIEPTYSGKE